MKQIYQTPNKSVKYELKHVVKRKKINGKFSKVDKISKYVVKMKQLYYTSNKSVKNKQNMWLKEQIF